MSTANVERFLVFTSDARKSFAEGMQKALPARYDICIIDRKYFPDGDPNFTIPRLHECYNRDVLFVADWSSRAARMDDLLCLVPIAELQPRTLTILIPFFSSGTMERESEAGSIATANVEAKLLSNLPGHSLKRIITVDLHTLQNQFYFENLTVTMDSTMRGMREKLSDLLRHKDTVICFPDDGAKKRFAGYFENVALATCAKVRDGDTRRVKLDEGDVDGKHIVIVDDLVRSGGTLLECARALKEHGATSIQIFVPHAVFPQESWRKFLDSDLIARFYTTDSVQASAQAIREADPESKVFEIWPLESCIHLP